MSENLCVVSSDRGLATMRHVILNELEQVSFPCKCEVMYWLPTTFVHLEANGMKHSKLTLDNVLLAKDQQGYKVKLYDFWKFNGSNGVLRR